MTHATSPMMAAALLACLLAPSVRAADLDELERQAFRAAVDRVAPSVVRIETIGGLERVERLLVGSGPTTGLVASDDGYILSSAFNFANKPASILVQLPDGSRKPARLVATDHNRMLVLLKIDPPKPLPVPAWAAKHETRVGQWAIAVGRAFDSSRPSLAVGVISAVNRIWGKAIQTDAAVSPNNYGGPLVDLHGRVLGLLVPMSPEEKDIVAGVEWYDSGIGFAVPAEDLQAIVPRLKSGKDLYPGVIGIRFASPSLHIADPVIAGSRPNSPAFKAGLKKDDRFLEIDGRKITRAAEIKEAISRRYAGEKLRVKIQRDGKPLDVEVELAEKLDPYAHPFLGILPLRNTPPAADGKPAGVTVRFVYPDSPAGKAGIVAGDVLASLGGQPIADAAQARLRISDYQPAAQVELQFRRDQETRKATVELAGLPEGVPAGPLPGAGKPSGPPPGERPEVGTFKMPAGSFKSEVWAYVPDDYDPAAAYGLVLWLHGAGGLKEKELIARWKPHCDRDRLILLAPKAADGDRWQPQDLEMIRTLVAQVRQRYAIDAARIVACGQEAGGRLACLVSFANPEAVRGVVMIDAPVAGQAPENEPDHRLAFYVARASKARGAEEINEAVEALREMKYPVTLKDLGEKPRPLSEEDLGELARWIDTLDRI